MIRILRALRRRLTQHDSDDGGFVLLESIIAISLITVIMSAVGAEYVSGLISTSHQRAEMTAIQLANSAVEDIRGLQPTDLITGRDSTSELADFALLSTIPAVQPWISTTAMTRAYDSKVTSGGASAAIPTGGVIKQPGKIKYRLYSYLGWCWTVDTTATCTSTVAPVQYLRAVVAVVWTQNGCPLNGCSYVTSTLVSTDDDPVFDLNQPLPAAPVVNTPSAQTVAVGDTPAALQLQVQNNTGVVPFTWQLTSGSLPVGLTPSPTGLITGTVGGVASAAKSVSFTVTDAFLRTATGTFTYTVLPRLVINTVSAQANTTASTANLVISATGGTGTGYTYTDPNSTLPPGLTLSTTGTVSGTPTVTPTVPTTYPVQITVTDSSGTRSATTSFPWTITYPPVAVTNPGTQTSTVNRADSLQLSASGGDNVYVWSATSLPAGLSISPTGNITGTPTTQQSVTVTATASDPTASVPPQSVSFTWAVVAMPIVTTPATQNSTIGSAPTLAITAVCANSPCNYALTGMPNGLAINSFSGLISGTIAANAVTSSNVRVVVTDAGGATVTTAGFTWTVFAAPTLTGLVTHSAAEGAVDNVAITYTCPYLNCKIDLTGSIPGIGLSATPNSSGNNTSAVSLTVTNTSGTVYLTGMMQSTAVITGTSKAYNLSLSITDGGGFKPTASTATWTAFPPAPTVSGVLAVNKVHGTTITNQPLTYTCAVATCVVKVTGQGSAAGLDADTSGSTYSTSLTVAIPSGTIYLRGAVSTAAGSPYSVVVTITDGNALTGTSSATWTVT